MENGNGNTLQVPDANLAIENGTTASNQFAIQWIGLSYTVRKGFIDRQLAALAGNEVVVVEKQIIKGIQGTIKSGELTAIMGPSGAGKSTLLECIAGIRERGRSGQISFHGHGNKVNLAFIPQQDAFFGVLTVREALIFASKLQNSTQAKKAKDTSFSVVENIGRPKLERSKTIKDEGFHDDIVATILPLLGLEQVADVRTKNLSGGQQRRLAIAQELVSKPDVLILDEPTSGLDSSASLHCIQMLQQLTQQKLPMAIVCTIHQPNPKIFNLFHKAIILSVTGKCIYEGPPSHIVDHLKLVDVECPSFYNPADFIIEVASGEHGVGPIEKLVAINERTPMDRLTRLPLTYNLKEVTGQPEFPYFSHFCYLLHRSFLLIVRNPVLMSLRFVSHFVIAAFVGWLYAGSGRSGGCPPDMGGGFSFDDMEAARNSSITDRKNILNNFGLLFMNCAMVQYFSLLPTLLSFPLQMSVFLKEKRNHWYHLRSYFWGMMIADTPFQIIFPTAYISIVYFATDQIHEWWRFEGYWSATILLALISQCQGLITGAIFMQNISAAVYIGTITFLPIFLFSGFFVKIETMPEILRPLTNLSFVRFFMEASIIFIYGFDRCGEDVKQKVEMMRGMLHGYLGRMLSIVHQALHEEEDLKDFGLDANVTEAYNFEKEVYDSDKQGMFSMSNDIVDTVIAGFGGGQRDEDGNLISGVMSLYGLEDDIIYRCFVMLLFYVVSLRIVTYLIIRWRANAKH